MNAFLIAVLGLAAWQAVGADVEQRLARGYRLLDDGKLEEAHRELSAAVAADPKSLDGRILLGMASYHLRRDEEAVRNLEAALHLDAGSIQATYVLGMVRLRHNELESAEQHLERAYDGDPKRADILQPLSQLLMARGDAPALARRCEQGRNAGIENAGLSLSLGWAYAEMGEAAKSEAATVAGLKISPQNKTGWLRLVKVQLQQGQAGRLRALETLERARQIPEVSAGWQHPYLVGLANYMLDRHDVAVEPLRAAVAMAPAEGPIHLLLAMCLTTIGESVTAEQHYHRALSLDGSNALFHYYYGLHLRRQRRMEEAAAEFRAALQRDTKLAEAYLNLGLVLDETGEGQEGIAAIEKAAALAPDLARAYYALGRIYARRNQPHRASAMMQRYQELKAGEAEQSQRRMLAGATSRLEAR